MDVLFQPYSITEKEKDKLAINPGQLIYTIDTHKVYLDYYNENNEKVRGEFGGATASKAITIDEIDNILANIKSKKES